MSRYYPKHSDEQLNQDFRLLYDHMYQSQARMKELEGKIAATPKAPAAPTSGSASHTKIAGLNVRGIPPSQGKPLTNLAGIPTLGYDAASGEITWFIPAS